MTEKKATNKAKSAKAVRKNQKYWHVLDAVQALNGSATIEEITAWLREKYPNEKHTDALENTLMLSVNEPNRAHYNKRNFRSDQDDPRDALFRTGCSPSQSYDLYIPSVHGVWDIRPNTNTKIKHKWEAFRIEAPLSEMNSALRKAREQIAAEQVSPIDNDHDARVWELRAVAYREGQPEFRKELLKAYDQKCAITGCGVIEILEAAHIRPYRGEHTNRIDNGLLLRADVHTLFDKGMVYIDAKGCVQIDKRLIGSEYESLRGCKLRQPKTRANYPLPQNLAYHRQHTAEQPIQNDLDCRIEPVVG